MIATPPLALRNRLAGTILAALHDEAARAELAALTSDAGAEAWAGPDAARWRHLVVERARRAHAALATLPPLDPERTLAAALAAAHALYEAGLYFEVHEVLEPWWARAEGRAREALQGLVQVAVGLQHLANGNDAGARALLADAAAHLHVGALAGADVEPLARAAAAAAARVPLVDPAALPWPIVTAH